MSLENHLKNLSESFNVPENKVMSWWRTSVRKAFTKNPFYLKFLEDHCQIIQNTNPRSMKRYPTIKRYQCNHCGGWFSQNDIEIDHKSGEHSCKEYSDAEGFANSILFVDYDDLQILCKDRKKTVKGEKVLSELGCHGIKTLSERNGISFEEARIRKEFLNIKKLNGVDEALKRWYINDIPKTKQGKEDLLYSLMLQTDMIKEEAE